MTGRRSLKPGNWRMLRTCGIGLGCRSGSSRASTVRAGGRRLRLLCLHREKVAAPQALPLHHAGQWLPWLGVHRSRQRFRILRFRAQLQVQGLEGLPHLQRPAADLALRQDERPDDAALLALLVVTALQPTLMSVASLARQISAIMCPIAPLRSRVSRREPDGRSPRLLPSSPLPDS